MDPLSDALGAVRSRDGVLHRSELCAPYGMLIDERSPLTVLLLLEGSGWLVFADGEEVELTRGVVHLVSCPEPHRVLDAPGSPVRILIDPEGARTVEGGRLPAPADEVRCLVEEPGDGTRTVMVSGNYAVAAGAGRRLLAALPRVARVGLPEVTHLVALLEAELERSAPGRQPVLDRWLDLVLTTALRAWADNASTGPAWAAAMADPQLGGVLRALHGDPARSWTVERMARVAGLSRSAFAERFTGLVGLAPLAYLTELRMDRATDLLLEDSAPLATVARAVGYANPYGFSAAYKRIRGIPPSQVRAAA